MFTQLSSILIEVFLRNRLNYVFSKTFVDIYFALFGMIYTLWFNTIAIFTQYVFFLIQMIILLTLKRKNISKQNKCSCSILISWIEYFVKVCPSEKKYLLIFEYFQSKLKFSSYIESIRFENLKEMNYYYKSSN